MSRGLLAGLAVTAALAAGGVSAVAVSAVDLPSPAVVATQVAADFQIDSLTDALRLDFQIDSTKPKKK